VPLKMLKSRKYANRSQFGQNQENAK